MLLGGDSQGQHGIACETWMPSLAQPVLFMLTVHQMPPSSNLGLKPQCAVSGIPSMLLLHWPAWPAPRVVLWYVC